MSGNNQNTHAMEGLLILIYILAGFLFAAAEMYTRKPSLKAFLIVLGVLLVWPILAVYDRYKDAGIL